jgi:hypothetical protein
VVRRFVEEKHVCWTYKLSCESKAPALTAAQVRDQLCSRERGIEAESMKYCVDARSNGVAAFPLEALEVFSVSIERGFTRVVLEARCLIDQRSLEREQVGELASCRFPNGRRAAELAMLLQ